MSLLSRIRPNGPNGFGHRSTAEQVVDGIDLSGKTMLITGVNSGIGRETTRVLAERGATVIGAARTMHKAEEACAEFGARAVPVECELSEPLNVIRCVEEVRSRFERLDAIIANAGIMALPERTVKLGLELQFLTNHIGHFLLVTRLLPSLAEDGRVVVVSSSAHRYAPRHGIHFDALDGTGWYKPWAAYGQSKLANALFALELSRRFHGSDRVANSLHPGVIATNLGRHMPGHKFFYAIGNATVMKSIPQGAATQTYLAAHPDGAGYSGVYFDDVNPGRPSRQAVDPELAKRLWNASEAIVNDIAGG